MTQTLEKTKLEAKSDSSPPLYIDAEKGRKSVLGYIQRGQITLANVDTFKDAEKAIWALTRPGVKKPKGLILDGASALATKTIQDVVLESPSALWDNRSKLQASQPTWGMMGGLMTRLFRVSRSLNIPLIITTAEQTREDKVNDVVTYFPALNPQVLTDVVHNADTVLRVFRTAGKRVVRCQPSDSFFAKIRVPDDKPPAPDVIVDEDKLSWTPVIKELHRVTGGLFTPLDESGEISPVVLYGMSGVGKTRLAVELILSV